MKEFKIIILAIFDKNDFSNKALMDIHGKPMIQYVFDSAKRSNANEIVIATDSPRVGMIAEEFGATVCMIVDEELKGISLLNEVVDKMKWDDDTVVVNFPADAPLTPRSIIKQVADNLVEHEEADCATLYSYVSRDMAEKDYSINLVVNKDSYVMYFSRCPIPHQVSASDNVTKFKCYIETNAYRVSFLKAYNTLPKGELDSAEKIDELKLLYNGMKIHAAEANSLIGQRVFVESDIEKVKMQIAPSR